MKDLLFNKVLFTRTMMVYLLSTVTWSALCSVTNEFNDERNGFVVGLGFLILFPLSIFIGLKIKDWIVFFFLIFLIIVLFLLGLLTFVFCREIPTYALLAFTIADSLLLAVGMVFSINVVFKIDRKIITCALIFIGMLIGHFILIQYNNHFNLQSSLPQRVVNCVIFQFFLIIPLTIGMTIKNPPEIIEEPRSFYVKKIRKN